MTLAPIEDQGLARWVKMIAPSRQLAEILSMTDFVPAEFRGKPDAIAACILYGDELGLEPMVALQSIYVVKGKPQPSSELARGLIWKAGHSLAVHEMNDTRVRVSGLRKDRPEAERVGVEWTMDMARTAGLANSPTWRAFPRAMLLARAFGDLGRILFPDVLKGLSWVAENDATAADLEVWGGAMSADQADQPAVAAEKPRKAIQRTTRPPSAPVADDRPPVAPDPAESPPSEPPPSGEPVTPDQAQAVGPGGWVDQELPPDLQPHGTGRPKRGGPEQAQPEQVRSGPISQGMVTALNILLRDQLGTAATRDEKLAFLSAILGRPVESSKLMTTAEGHQVRDWFGKLEAGQVAFDMDPESGAVSVRDVTP